MHSQALVDDGLEVLRSWTMGFDLSAKRELNNGFGNALNAAVELAVTPAALAFIGWQIDRWLGTAPLFLILLFTFTIVYVAWKQFRAYDATMRRQEQELLGAPTERRRP
jgi:F0F1-type ATP synthase assembly protein I